MIKPGRNMPQKTNSSSSTKGTRRRRISDSSLHISAFLILRRGNDSVMLLRAGNSHPVSFRRGKLLLPSTMLNFGEDPKEAAKRILRSQVEGAENIQPRFLEIQSYLGSHWDICFVYECDALGSDLRSKQPYVGNSFYSLAALPSDEIAEDHLEVIDGLQNKQ